MKKDGPTKNLKLKLHRETLRALEEPQLEAVAGGASAASCPTGCATTCTRLC